MYFEAERPEEIIKGFENLAATLTSYRISR
jgi:hypothetical protein